MQTQLRYRCDVRQMGQMDEQTAFQLYMVDVLKPQPLTLLCKNIIITTKIDLKHQNNDKIETHDYNKYPLLL